MLSYREGVSKLSSSVAQSQGKDLTCIASNKSTGEHHHTPPFGLTRAVCVIFRQHALIISSWRDVVCMPRV